MNGDGVMGVLDRDFQQPSLDDFLDRDIPSTDPQKCRRFSGSNISADVWKPKEKSGTTPDDSSGHIAANGSDQSGRSSRNSEQRNGFRNSPRGVSNMLELPPRATHPPSEAKPERRNSSRSNASRRSTQEKPLQDEGALFTSSGDDDRETEQEDDTSIDLSADPRDEEIEDLKHVAEASQRSLQVMNNEIRMLKEANRKLLQDMESRDKTSQHEVASLKRELTCCYKKNISLSKSSKANAAAVERLEEDLEKRDAKIATLEATISALK